MSIQHIIFDVGEVLFAYEPRRIITQLLGDTPHEDFYLSTLFDSQLWQQLDRGDVSRAEARDHLAACSDSCAIKTRDLHHLFEEWVHHLSPIPETKALFEALDRDYPLYILSNFQDQPFDRLVENHRFLDLAQGHVVSGKLNMMKPEIAIYEHLLERFELEASECVFIDDRPENIEAATGLGMSGVVFRNPHQAIGELKQLGVRMPQSVG